MKQLKEWAAKGDRGEVDPEERVTPLASRALTPNPRTHTSHARLSAKSGC